MEGSAGCSRKTRSVLWCTNIVKRQGRADEASNGAWDSPKTREGGADTRVRASKQYATGAGAVMLTTQEKVFIHKHVRYVSRLSICARDVNCRQPNAGDRVFWASVRYVPNTRVASSLVSVAPHDARCLDGRMCIMLSFRCRMCGACGKRAHSNAIILRARAYVWVGKAYPPPPETTESNFMAHRIIIENIRI